MHAIRIAAALAAMASACTELDDVSRDVCGNGVVEPGNAEDCDGSERCGLPDSAQACRVLCGDTAPCPGTAACGIDAICHAPGGSFAAAASFAWTASHLLVADTSADGYPELVGVGGQQVEVRLGGPDLGFSALPAIPAPPLFGHPQAADLDGDGDVDVAIPVEIGVFSLSGHPSTVLDPFFYNSFDAPAEGRIVGTGVKFANLISVPLIAARDAATGNSVVLFVSDDPLAGALFPPGRTIDEVVGQTLAVGTLRDNSLTERTIALPFGTGQAIWLYDASAAALTSLTLTRRAAPVMLPGTATVKYGVWFADFDGDGHVDLVASIEQNGAEGMAVAWGRGDGVVNDTLNVVNQASIIWRADGDQDNDGVPDGPLLPVQVGQVTDNLVLIGDENDADVVGAGGLYLTSCAFRNQCALRLLRASTRAWAGAEVADVNGDGRPDVIAFARDQTGLDLLLNTSTTLLFNDAAVATSGAVERLFPGDFNGDSIVDLAYVDASTGVPYTDALSVAFGRYLSPPGEAVFMGSIGELVAGGDILGARAGGAIDFVSDLVVVTDREVDGEVRRGAAVAFGSTAGRLFAPLLPADIALTGRTIVSSLVDDFFLFDGNADGLVDLALLTTTVYGPSSSGGVDTQPLTVHYGRFYTGQSDGQVAEAAVVEIALSDADIGRALWRGADVRGGPEDEAVALLADGRLLILQLDGGCSGEACVTVVPAPASAVTNPVSFQAADADGDGDLDLLGVMRNRGGSPGQRTPALLVWRNQDGFGLANQQRFDGAIADATIIDRERDGTPELVVLFHDDGLKIATHTAGGFTDLVALAEVTDGVALQAADVNGDALLDLVVLAGVEREAPRELIVLLQSEERIVP